MKQVLIRQGGVVVEDVPAPTAAQGCLLVRLSHSCISVGTELSGITSSGTPLWKRALKDPWKVRKAIEMVATRGFLHTTSVVRGELNAGSATGYSAAGLVVGVGQGVEGFVVGDRVACAGAQFAHHAEYICVPANLTVKMPQSLAFAPASTVTLGAIAMQGVRRALPTLGETFVVVGLGILGQLTAQLLRANGCRVIGIDMLPDRVEQAISLGMDCGFSVGDGDAENRVQQISGGIGADGVIVTAASQNEKLLTESFRLCRRKGRVVLVGDVPMRLDRGDLYRKEIDFYISTSYGPGRYDQRYEEQGLDYPVGYVRWTENRNMQEYLRLLASGAVEVDALIGSVRPLVEAPQAYQALRSADSAPLMVLLEYPQPEALGNPVHRVDNPRVRLLPGGDERIRIGLIGAGAFAKGMHLPNLQGLADHFTLQAVSSRSGHNAQAVARQFEAAYATTSNEEILTDDSVDAVLIATRHHLHADLVLAALQAGKHVLVEKPLAMSEKELKKIEDFFDGRDQAPVLLTGFNRRFSRHMQPLLELAAQRTNPFIANYRMNAGHIPSDHWVHGAEGGGRNIGEACHIYDLFTAMAGQAVKAVDSMSITPVGGHFRRDDNFVATFEFEDSSVATLTYTALGHKDHPKERLELYVDGMVGELDDYRRSTIIGLTGRGGTQSATPDKGQREELVAFADAIQGKAGWPIPMWQQLQAMRMAFAVQRVLDGLVSAESQKNRAGPYIAETG